MTPFKAKPRSPAVDQALEDFRSSHAEVDRLRLDLKQATDRRAKAIRAALDHGASLRELAGLVGMSPEAIRKAEGLNDGA